MITTASGQPQRIMWVSLSSNPAALTMWFPSLDKVQLRGRSWKRSRMFKTIVGRAPDGCNSTSEAAMWYMDEAIPSIPWPTAPPGFYAWQPCFQWQGYPYDAYASVYGNANAYCGGEGPNEMSWSAK
eukprot:g29571.t1